MRDAATFFAKVRNLLETYGWMQFQYGSEEQGFCLRGAAVEAQTKLSDETGERITCDEGGLCYACLFDEKLREHFGITSIVRYNDTAGRTKEEVMQLLKDAEEKCK